MRGLCLIPLLLLCACASTPRNDPARYDLGPAAAGKARLPGLALRTIEVSAPSWLASPAMQYRLAYSQGARREAYADSRWAAPPAELLERALTRRVLASAGQSASDGCRLALELDEFIQAFDAPGASHVLLEVRVALLAPHGDALLARRAFSRQSPAGADAKSGAAAFSTAASTLGDEVVAWLDLLARDTPEVVSRCRGSN